MGSTSTGAFILTTFPPVRSDSLSSNPFKGPSVSCCSIHGRSFAAAGSSAPTTSPDQLSVSPKKFTYSRASPSVRWPHLNLSVQTHPPPQPLPSPTGVPEEEPGNRTGDAEASDESQEVLGRLSRTQFKKRNKLALKRAKDWRERVRFMTDKILGLKPDEFVADVLDERSVQLTPTDFCFVVKWIGQSNWQRALEVYEWLNLRHWYSPNARMLATILSVLGKANQESLAIEIFTRAESSVGNTVQVYNAMMGVYARNGRFTNVQHLLDVMRERGCEPDLVSFNTLINARVKSNSLEPNLAIQLLNEVRAGGLRPDIITYNTLISACSRESNLDEATKIYNDMETHKCQPDLWTYNAMISVYGRCGLSSRAEKLFKELESRGFLADAVTYNSLLYAFAREGKTERVRDICDEMVSKGFGKDEMTYNTIIHMYGKQGKSDLALQAYEDMKSCGRKPDAVTYTVLIDSLGKSNKTKEAENVMSEMLDSGVKPTLRTYSALICAYAKAGKRVEAEETYECMQRCGIKPDTLAYSVMLDILLRFNETRKAMSLYREMVRDGYVPDSTLYEMMIRTLVRENYPETIDEIVRDMEGPGGMNASIISSVLVKGECYDRAAVMLKQAISNGFELDRDDLLSILGSYSSSMRHSEALDLLEFLRDHAGSSQLLSEALVIMLCKAGKVDSAVEEYNKAIGSCSFAGSSLFYETLIQCCMENKLFAEASQVISDMRFYGVGLTKHLYQKMVHIYCEMAFPETANYLVDEAGARGITFDDSSTFVTVIREYGRLKLWQRAESIVGNLRQRLTVNRSVWNALIEAYAVSGCYERARAVFNTMMRDGPSPSVESINGLLQALITDGRLDELYVVIQELQEMGFKVSKSSILLMLEAFARAGNILEVQKIYAGMRAAGYFPTMHIYRTMIGLLCKGKRLRDAEAMVIEMEDAGFKPDLSILNSMLRMYARTEDFKKTIQVYQQIQEAGLSPDEITYNILIIMYCRNCRPEVGLSLMHEMKGFGLDPKLDTYKSLISALGKQDSLEQAEELFKELLSKGYKLDRSFYHTMMKFYRNSGDHSKAEQLFFMMREAGVEPTVATMHLLMISYGSSGQPQEAERVFNSLSEAGADLTTLPYSSVIDAYLRNGDYGIAIKKLGKMKAEGLQPDHRIWTLFIRAASLCKNTSEAVNLLNALGRAGFDLPIRLLTEKSSSFISEVENMLDELQPLEDNAALNWVNALEDLLWAFELRAIASSVFQLAIKKEIYQHNVFRVAEKDWGADFRRLSAGASLVGLTLWLDRMQEASLQGSPESPKSVVLITGTSDYNSVSLNSTLKVFLWEMGSPFLPCKTRTGLLVAKAHSLRMWLKDSPFCLDLELRDALSLPEVNSMQLIEGCFIRRGLVPAYKDITDRLGMIWPKKFSRLALLPDDKRDRAIQADIEGSKERLNKLKGKEHERTKKGRKLHKGKVYRR
ncbi:hypothetical protein SAY87_024252 [Trapa incisa]|uniref:Pentatricopeptide repeat-containing protein n=1 Tax=Trapa incisa TaxID=236973 RepID=A0AAN7JF14_9MYRT|nr:hypothetical protein SAY87_024252 [Trapa incisa]